MRLTKEGIFLTVVLCSVASVSFAQQTREREAARSEFPSNHQKASLQRTLTPDEGLAVLGAALESGSHLESKSDCSHFVHAIYERAGFPFSYASSSDLYAGTAEFRRVARPQPGDLVVWLGHVGIVINPAQRSFFSALRSGLHVDSYASSYWKSRGHPHFFRYVTQTPVRFGSAYVGRTPSRKAVEATSSESSSHNAENTDLIARNGTESQGQLIQTDPDLVMVRPNHSSLVHAARPTAAEVREVLEQGTREAGAALRGQSMLKISYPLVVFDEVTVQRVRLQHEEGWVEVSFNGALSFPGAQAASTKHVERQRWPMIRRDDHTWALVPPDEPVYVPSDIAVLLLAHQLAMLTERSPAQAGAFEEEVEISKLLNTLLQR